MICNTLTARLVNAARDAFALYASQLFPFAGFIYRNQHYFVIGERSGGAWILHLRALYPEYQRGGAVFLPQKYPDFAVTDDYIYRIRREYGE